MVNNCNQWNSYSCMRGVCAGSDVVVRTGVKGRLGQHYVQWPRCRRSRFASTYFIYSRHISHAVV